MQIVLKQKLLRVGPALATSFSGNYIVDWINKGSIKTKKYFQRRLKRGEHALT